MRGRISLGAFDVDWAHGVMGMNSRPCIEEAKRISLARFKSLR